MQWTEERTLDIINKYKARPILWDMTHENYYNSTKKLLAWTEIGREMNIDAEDARTKIYRLLSILRSEAYRMKKRVEKHGTGYVTPWFAFKSLQFYLDRKKPERSQRIVFEPLNKQTTRSADDESVDLAEPGCSTQEDLPLGAEDEVSNAESEDKDECDTFAMYLAHKLRSYSSLTRSHVEFNISNILFHADMGAFESKTASGDIVAKEDGFSVSRISKEGLRAIGDSDH